VSDHDDPPDFGVPDLDRRGEWLRRVFPNLREPLLSETARRLQFVRVAAGTAVIRQGEMADAVYIIVKGRASVVREDRTGTQAMAATLGPGQFFGEMALLAGEDRNASVYAATDLDVLRLDADGVRRVVDGDLGSTRSTRIDGDSDPVALPPLAHHDTWVRNVRSACHALVASHHAVRSIDLLGQPIEDEGPATLLQLTDLARRTASEYGIEVSVSQVGGRPVLHLSTSRYV
jgi:CRP-like cAMP-binding protein